MALAGGGVQERASAGQHAATAGALMQTERASVASGRAASRPPRGPVKLVRVLFLLGLAIYLTLELILYLVGL
jgi:hypothetical protein